MGHGQSSLDLVFGWDRPGSELTGCNVKLSMPSPIRSYLRVSQHVAYKETAIEFNPKEGIWPSLKCK